MQKPAFPPNEARRQRALMALQILDTPIEERFERITRAASRELRMPMAAISLVDGVRQWFKSSRGIDACETGRDISFCGHAILAPGAFVVPDARRDRRFSDNPLVTGEPGIRFYAGHPVKAPDGSPVGTLCVLDRKPRRFGKRARTVLRGFAADVEQELQERGLSEAQRSLAAGLPADTRQAAVDSLTRVWTREAILEILEREFAAARRKKRSIGVFFTDVDQCERLNRRKGVDVGDAAVREAAVQVLQSVRPQDAVGRFGSEEFLGVVALADRATLLRIANAIRRNVAAARVASPHGKVRMTASVGAAWGKAQDLPGPGALIDAADAALSWAQWRGGNRVELGSL